MIKFTNKKCFVCEKSYLAASFCSLEIPTLLSTKRNICSRFCFAAMSGQEEATMAVYNSAKSDWFTQKCCLCSGPVKDSYDFYKISFWDDLGSFRAQTLVCCRCVG